MTRSRHYWFSDCLSRASSSVSRPARLGSRDRVVLAMFFMMRSRHGHGRGDVPLNREPRPRGCSEPSVFHLTPVGRSCLGSGRLAVVLATLLELGGRIQTGRGVCSMSRDVGAFNAQTAGSNRA